MRNYEGMRLPPAIDPHLRNELLKVDKFLKQLPAALRKSLEQGNNPRAVVSGGGGAGGGGSSNNLPDHTHSGTGDGGAQLGIHNGVIKGYGKLIFVDPTAPQVQFGDTSNAGENMILVFFTDSATGLEPARTIISFGASSAALSGPQTTADTVGCVGARLYLYKDPNGTYDAVYGQSFVDNWVMPGPEDVTYSIFTGAHPGAPFLRGQWAGNGDYTNYGFVWIKKNGSAGSPSTPALLLEETGSGTDFISLRAPAAVSTGGRIQVLSNVHGRIPVVGDDPPAVASGAMGMVDDTAKTAAIGSTNLTNASGTGFYKIYYYMECTTANAGASAVTFTVGYTDSVGATTQNGPTTLTCTAPGRTQGELVLYVNSGNITYSTTWATPSGAVMNLRVRVLYLG